MDAVAKLSTHSLLFSNSFSDDLQPIILNRNVKSRIIKSYGLFSSSLNKVCSKSQIHSKSSSGCVLLVNKNGVGGNGSVNNPYCTECGASGDIPCRTCSTSGLYIDSVLESQGILVKVCCLGCGGSGRVMCTRCGGWGTIRS